MQHRACSAFDSLTVSGKIIVTGEDIRTVRTSLPKMSRSSSTLESVKGMPPRLLFPSQNDVAADELRYPIVSKAVAGVLLDLVTTSAHTQWLLVLIHQPTFREEFAMYWQNPMNVDLVWLAILYSILSIGGFVASRSMIFIEDAPNFEHISHVCLNRAAQCLRNSDYTKPVANTISAMVGLHIERSSSLLNTSSCFILLVSISLLLMVISGAHSCLVLLSAWL